MNTTAVHWECIYELTYSNTSSQYPVPVVPEPLQKGGAKFQKDVLQGNIGVNLSTLLL